MKKNEFIDFLICSGVLMFGDFVTKSGRKTPYFINTGNFVTGEQLLKLGSYYADCIAENMESGKIPKDTNVLFGPAYKGIPLSVTTLMALKQDHNMDLNYCFNRKEEKDHGEGGSIIGYNLKDGDKVLIIEDVITAGTSVREVLPILYGKAAVEVVGIVVAVDRMEKGRKAIPASDEIFEEFGIPTFSIVNIKEILELHPLQKFSP